MTRLHSQDDGGFEVFWQKGCSGLVLGGDGLVPRPRKLQARLPEKKTAAQTWLLAETAQYSGTATLTSKYPKNGKGSANLVLQWENLVYQLPWWLGKIPKKESSVAWFSGEIFWHYPEQQWLRKAPKGESSVAWCLDKFALHYPQQQWLGKAPRKGTQHSLVAWYATWKEKGSSGSAPGQDSPRSWWWYFP